MIPINRAGLAAPKRWQTSLNSAIADYNAFVREAAAFEAKPLAERLASPFSQHVPATLPAKKGKSKWPDKWRSWKSIKKKLMGMAHDKCAYCESMSGADQWGQVEHFKPKSLFPSVAYDWDNYLYSCELCNQTKSNKWPASGSYVRPDVAGFSPDVFAFGDDGSIAGVGDDAKATVTDFGLDREGLTGSREVVIEAKLRTLGALDVLGLTADQARGQYKAHWLDAKQAYSEAINRAIRRAWEARYPAADLGI